MTRRTKQAIIDELKRTLKIEQEGIRERDARIAKMETKLSYAMQAERRFDQLLEGMCMGMREGNLPRRSS